MRLKQRYTLYIVIGVAVITALQWIVVYFNHVSRADDITTTTSIVLDRALERQFNLRAETLSETLAETLAPALLQKQLGLIEAISRESVRIDDIKRISIYSPETGLVFDTDTGFAEQGVAAPASIERRVYENAQQVKTRTGDRLTLDGPLMMADRVIGAYRMTMSFEGIARERAALALAIQDELVQQSENQLKLSIIVGGLLSALVGVAGYFVARRISEPILHLKEQARQLGQGQFNLEPLAKRNDELGELSDALYSAADNLKVTTISRAYFNNIVESMLDPVVVVNAHGRVLDVNSSAAKLLRCDKHDLLGQPFAGYCLDQKKRPAKPMDVRAGRVGFVQTTHGRVIPVLFSSAPLAPLDDSHRGYVCVFRDISDLLESERRLEEALHRAETANETKSAFVANTSHELRTPLNAIIGFAELIGLQTHGPLQAKYLEYLEDIRSSADHLRNIVDDVLDLSKVEAGRLELTETDFEVGEAVADVIRIISPEAENRCIELNDLGVPDGLILRADARYVRQMLMNLVSNAVRYNRENGRVDIAATASPDGLLIAVSDTGVGIPEEDQATIVEPFSQGRNTMSQAAGGTGLGLALTSALIGRHGGRLSIVSQENQGTTVTLWFPKRRIIRSTDQTNDPDTVLIEIRN